MSDFKVIEDNGTRAYVYKGFLFRDDEFDDLMLIQANERSDDGQ